MENLPVSVISVALDSVVRKFFDHIRTIHGLSVLYNNLHGDYQKPSSAAIRTTARHLATLYKQLFNQVMISILNWRRQHLETGARVSGRAMKIQFSADLGLVKNVPDTWFILSREKLIGFYAKLEMATVMGTAVTMKHFLSWLKNCIQCNNHLYHTAFAECFPSRSREVILQDLARILADFSKDLHLFRRSCKILARSCKITSFEENLFLQYL